MCIVPGNASQNARTRTSAKVRALKIMTASADAYNWLDADKKIYRVKIKNIQGRLLAEE